ncbi:HNH endonuclease signature motif containing protein [Streptomyces sp. SLBN-115]|uniref:HNH endonuclease signature motif containing protein n=1 Tax=Streptomyces sp. SLBN-115 TaxID=2768453 RepID=UPI001170BB4B|nr:HNH endonuclease signature motif containing protein [Streptomyces sp. SLBN-115]TQJ56006.1 HNH endonuclease [Streptomyces sp. SLBN-115]
MKTFLDITDKAAVLAYVRNRSIVWPAAEGGCWEWVCSTTPDGYGRFTADKRSYYSHREAFKASGRRIPEGWTLDHLCQNRACCNPIHLEPVTRGENTRRARNAYWVAFMKEHFAARRILQNVGGSVIQSGVNA